MKDYYGKDATRLKDKKLFLFDMDGTIYLGDNLFEGVPELLQKIENKGGRYAMNYEEYRFDSIPSTQDFLRENRDIQKFVSGRKQRFACLLYDLLGWYGAARLVRLGLTIRYLR